MTSCYKVISIDSTDLTIHDLIQLTLDNTITCHLSADASISGLSDAKSPIAPSDTHHAASSQQPDHVSSTYQHIVTMGLPVNKLIVRLAAVILCRELAARQLVSHSATLLSSINGQTLPIVINKYSDKNMISKLLYHIHTIDRTPIPTIDLPIFSMSVDIINSHNMGNVMTLARFIYDLLCQMYTVVLTDDYTPIERSIIARIGARVLSKHQARHMLVFNTLSSYMHDYLRSYMVLSGAANDHWPSTTYTDYVNHNPSGVTNLTTTIRSFITNINYIIIILLSYSNSFSPDELRMIRDYMVSLRSPIMADIAGVTGSSYQEQQTVANAITTLIKSLSVITAIIGKDYGSFTTILTKRHRKRHHKDKKTSSKKDVTIKANVDNIMKSLRTAYSSDNYLSYRLLEKICDNIVPSTMFINMLTESGY